MSIEFKKVNYIYGENTPFSYIALKDVSLKIPQGSFTALIGHTGSGKSTLIQHINALLLPTSGEVDIDEFVWSASPEEKLNKITELKSNGHKVAMTGDGTNDSAALAKADISIAIGEGTDVAINTSQVVIMNGELNNIYKTFVLSKEIVKTIKQNLFWAFIYNLVGIPIAAGVLYPIFNIMLSPIICAAAMALSSVSVVLNSLTINAKKI